MAKVISSGVTVGQANKSEILTVFNILLHDFAQSQPTSMTYSRETCYNLEQGPRNQIFFFGGLEAISSLFSMPAHRLAIYW